MPESHINWIVVLTVAQLKTVRNIQCINMPLSRNWYSGIVFQSPELLYKNNIHKVNYQMEKITRLDSSTKWFFFFKVCSLINPLRPLHPPMCVQTKPGLILEPEKYNRFS